MTRAAQALLKFSNLRHNYRVARKSAPGKAWAVIKANAYGHGILPCAKALAAEADGFAVACVDEAMTLRDAGIEHPLLVLEGAFDSQEWELASRHSLRLAVHHPLQLKDCRNASLDNPVRVWLKINSGMNRLGVRFEDAPEMIARLHNDPNLRLEQVMSHYASADEEDPAFYLQQQKRMMQHKWPAPVSISNSAGIMRGGADGETAIRPGIMLYGSSPLAGKSAADLGLKPVMTLQSALISTHKVPAGETVGYARAWTAPRDSVIGVVAMGYGDGYPRHAPAGTPVNVAGQTCPLVGRVSMDMITVDITDAPQAVVGSPVELWGELVDVDEVARLSGTISYELFCRLTPRVPRINFQ